MVGFVPAVTLPLVSTVTLRYVPPVTPVVASVRVIAVVPEPEASPVTEMDWFPVKIGDQLIIPFVALVNAYPFDAGGADGYVYDADPATAGAVKVMEPDVDPEKLIVPLISRESLNDPLLAEKLLTRYDQSEPTNESTPNANFPLEEKRILEFSVLVI